MLGIYRKDDDLKDDEELDPPGRAARKVKPELIVRRELLRVLPLGALSFVLQASFSKEVATVSGSMMVILVGSRLSDCGLDTVKDEAQRLGLRGCVGEGNSFVLDGKDGLVISWCIYIWISGRP